MKLDAELDQAGIEALKNGIPNVDEYTIVEGEKSLDRLAGPTAGFPSAEQSDRQVGHLIQKANRALKRAV